MGLRWVRIVPEMGRRMRLVIRRALTDTESCPESIEGLDKIRLGIQTLSAPQKSLRDDIAPECSHLDLFNTAHLCRDPTQAHQLWSPRPMRDDLVPHPGISCILKDILTAAVSHSPSHQETSRILFPLRNDVVLYPWYS